MRRNDCGSSRLVYILARYEDRSRMTTHLPLSGRVMMIDQFLASDRRSYKVRRWSLPTFFISRCAIRRTPLAMGLSYNAACNWFDVNSLWTDVRNAGELYSCSTIDRKSIRCCRRTGPGRIVTMDKHGEEHWPVLLALYP
jgi:hypothetical protein